MEEIKVRDYIRTTDGYIRKVTQVNRKGSYEGLCYGAYSVDKKYKNSVGISANKIKSHKKNIIDLIEVGDIVNQSERILDITGDYILTTERNCCKSRFEKTIKTILTHEMYEQNCYKVGEENE